MAFISNNIYNFIYIAVIVLGGVTLTLSLILYAKERDARHRGIVFFINAIFVYMIIDFITYYCLGEKIKGNVMFSLITVSDILFCGLVVAWIYFIVMMLGLGEVVKIRPVVIITVVYALVSQILSVTLGRYDSYIMVESGIGKVVLQILNVAYVVVVIAICIRCLLLLFKKYNSSRERMMNSMLVIGLIGYMVWIAYWDYNTWYETENNLLSIYALDPLILIYAMLNIYLIYYFYKKDPLKLSGFQIASENAVALMAERYGLSMREKEVLDLMNCGRSNAQIAGELCISENTVKRHANSIFRKTQTQCRHEVLYKISNER
ncbi:MAG: helix-turn-helix transcriptional regulator [Clostridiales bacterium]|nr:helix-turn-helix transcriptional regulator [Clostridiales bacterium]